MGLVRFVYASRLQPIEDAIASLGSNAPVNTTSNAPQPQRTAAMSAAPPPSRAASAPPPPPPPPPPAQKAMTGDDLRSRLHARFVEAKQTHLADVIESCEMTETASEVVFTGPKMYQMFIKDALFETTVRQLASKRAVFKVGEAAASAAPAKQPDNALDSEVATRALAHPEVQRFQELFPDSQVRAVRNLRENE